MRPTPFHHRGQTLQLGCAEIWVPGKKVVYVAPSHVLHYIKEHDYTPPEEFVTSLLSFQPWNARDVEEAIKAVVRAV